MTDFDFDAVAELLVREHAERTSDEDARDAIALQLRRAFRAGVEAGIEACTREVPPIPDEPA